MSGAGHNSIAVDVLRSFVERVERLVEDRKEINGDIRDVIAEAKAQGYDGKTIREMVRIRAMEKEARDEKFALLSTYAHALGMDLV